MTATVAGLERRPLLEPVSVVAVAERIVLEVLLMIRRAGVEDSGGSDISHYLLLRVLDLARVHQLLQLGLDLLCNAHLRIVVAEDDRGILGAAIVALSIHRGRVVEHEEVADELLEGFISTIEFHVVDLYMTRRPRAYLSVGGIRLGSWRTHLTIIKEEEEKRY